MWQPGGLLLLLLLFADGHHDVVGGGGAHKFFVDPATVKVMHNRRAPFPSSADRIDLAAQRGECERSQVWTWSDEHHLSDVRVHFSNLQRKTSSQIRSEKNGAATLSKELWTYKQQGYVHTKASTYYNCIEDILNNSARPKPLPPPNHTKPTWCDTTPPHECRTGCKPDPKGTCGGGAAPPGSCNMCKCNVAGTKCADDDVNNGGHTCLEGWYPDPLLDVPTTGIPLIPKSFTQSIFLELCVPYGQHAGNYSGTIQVTAGGKPLFYVPAQVEVFDIDLPLTNDSAAFSTAFTFDPISAAFYPSMSPEQVYVQWLSFLAHYRIPGDELYLHTPRTTAQYQQLALSGAKWMNLLYAGLPSHDTEIGVAKTLDILKPIVQNLSALRLLDKSYVYGFDEMKIALNRSVYDIFGQIKQRWPEIRTVATLDWQAFPSDLPLNVWVDEIEDYGASPSYSLPTSKEILRQKWIASGANSSTGSHSFWWYWCIGPTDPNQLNTFVERPAIQGRLIFWLSALHHIDGMLYYSVNRWTELNGNCSRPSPKCQPMRRINNTALTDFSPATFRDANGDGSFTYPGEHGPLATIRLANIADGIEDWELFNRLGTSHRSISRADDLITQLISNITAAGRVENPALLERVRRQAAHRIMANSKTLDGG